MIGSLYSKQNGILSDTKIQWKNRYDGHSIDLLGGFRFMKPLKRQPLRPICPLENGAQRFTGRSRNGTFCPEP